MIQKFTFLTLACALSLAITHAAEPAFFAMDTGTRDAKHKTPEEQVSLVREIGFAGIAPIYQKPEILRDTLSALDQRKLRIFAVYVTINGADAKTVELPRVIQPLDSGDFDVEQVLIKLAELGWHGPIGLQHYGIGGDARVNLQRSMTAWREMTRKVWTASGAKSQQKADWLRQPHSTK